MIAPGLQRGLTLIELLVVMVLISIIVSFSVLSLDFAGSEEKLKDESRRLQRLLVLAKEEAILQNRELAVVLDKNAYRFQELQERKWQDISDDRILRPRELEAGIELKLDRDEAGFTLTKKEENSETDADSRIFIMSSGESIPFRLELKAEGVGHFYRLEGDSLGRFKLEGPIETL